MSGWFLQNGVNRVADFARALHGIYPIDPHTTHTIQYVIGWDIIGYNSDIFILRIGLAACDSAQDG